MLINVLWMTINPGFRDSGVAKLKGLAQIMKDDQGVEAGVLMQVVTGSPYLAGLVSFHEDTATHVKAIATLEASEKFGKWFENTLEDFNWAKIESQSYRMLRPGGGKLPNFIYTTAIDILPGKLQPAREYMDKMAAYVKTACGVDVGVYHFEGGAFYRHFWVADYESLEQYEQVQATLSTDEKWGELAEGMADLFDRSSLESSFGQYV